MNDFWLWFSTGFKHIASLDGCDHILFVCLLVFAFPLKDWKKLLLLVTAFTLGHSLSLALSVGGIIKAPRALTEFLIALSILLTAAYQLFRKSDADRRKAKLLYAVVTLFGLIHGMGFSYLLSAMLSAGESLVAPLLFFNLGLEAGQVLIVAAVVLFSLLLTGSFKLPFQPYKQLTLCIIALIALKLCVERSPELF